MDKRLPSLLALLLDGKRDVLTLKRTLSLVLPEMNMDNRDTALQTLAWQKRVRDELVAGRPWTAWFAISEEEYQKLASQPEDDIHVRALLAPVEQEEQPTAAQTTPPLAEAEPTSETLRNAKNIWLSLNPLRVSHDN